MSERRSVRVDPFFFDLLDQQLREERGPNGEPSAGDFLLVDLPLIAEVFATQFETLAMLLPPSLDDASVRRRTFAVIASTALFVAMHPLNHCLLYTSDAADE